MELKNLDQIKEDGLVVFMPSGIQATLKRDGDNVIVEYYNMQKDTYSNKEFENIMNEGILIFSEQPTIAQQSVLMESEESNEDVFEAMLQFADNEGVNITDLKEYDPFEIADFCSNFIGKEVSTEEVEEEIRIAEEDKAALEDEIEWEDGSEPYSDDKELRYQDFFGESLNKLSKKGYIRDSLVEAYKQEDNYPGGVFINIEDKHEYMTPEFKIELLDCLDKIAKMYPNTHIRQQALSFRDELGINEPYDVKTIKDFASKYMKILNAPVVESLEEQINEEEYAIYKGGKKIAAPFDTFDQALYNASEIAKDKGYNLDDLDIVSLGNYDNKKQQVVMPENVNESKSSLAEEIRNGNKSGEDPELGEWLLETSVDEKWEALTKGMKDYLCNEIADYVEQGSLEEKDLQIELDKDAGLTNADLKSLNMFTEEDIQKEDQFVCLLSFEIRYDDKEPKEESFKEKKKKDKKKKIDDSIEESLNEKIYLKDQEGNEEGPFQDQEAADQFVKDQKKAGEQKEYEEVIKEEDMSKITEDVYKVYNNIDPDAGFVNLANWNEVEDHLNKTWGEYKADMAKKNPEFGTEQDRLDFLGNFEVSMEPVEIEIEDIPAEGIELPLEPAEECPDCCPDCGKEPCECEPEELTEPAEEPMNIESEQEVEDAVEDAEEIEEAVNEDELDKEACLRKSAAEEEEAVANYLHRAKKAKEHNDEEIADLYGELADDEKVHAAQLQTTMDKLGMNDPETQEQGEEEAEEILDDKNEDFEDEHIGKSEEAEEPVEEQPEEAEQENQEITTPEEAEEKVDEIEDALDSIEDFISGLIGEEDQLDPEEIEEIAEMCMTKLPNPEDVKKDEDNEEEKEEEKNEAFSDNMGMLTDINDLDFPDALVNTVETKEDGSLYRLGDIAKLVQELKAEIESVKDEFKSALDDLKQGIKDDVKDIQTDVTSKLDNTDSKIDDLTSEEEELEMEEEPIEEQPEETEEPEEETPEEDLEEAITINKYLKRSTTFMEKCKAEKDKEIMETLDDLKKTVDKMAQEQKDAQEIKDAITLQADNDQEAEQAKEYAVNKLTEKLLNSKGSSICGHLFNESVDINTLPRK